MRPLALPLLVGTILSTTALNVSALPKRDLTSRESVKTCMVDLSNRSSDQLKRALIKQINSFKTFNVQNPATGRIYNPGGYGYETLKKGSFEDLVDEGLRKGGPFTIKQDGATLEISASVIVSRICVGDTRQAVSLLVISNA